MMKCDERWWKVMMKYDEMWWWNLMKGDGEIWWSEIWWWNIVKHDLDKGFLLKNCFHHYGHLCVFVVFTTVHVRKLEKVAIPILQTKYYSMIYLCSNYSSFVSIVTGDACSPRRQENLSQTPMVHQDVWQTFASLFLPPTGVCRQTFRPSW